MPIFLAGADPEFGKVLTSVLIQLCVMILAARVFANLFRWMRQPAVVGEIMAGLILGPSVLGKLFPGVEAFIFDHSSPLGIKAEYGVKILSQLGLIFLLFLIGLEFDFGHLKTKSRSAISISIAGIALPFGLGFGLAYLIHDTVAREVPFTGFALFMGVAMSITAIPILGRIMMELNITRTKLGAITITAAAVDDAIGWILLATIAAMVRAAFDPVMTIKMILETIAFALAMVFLVRPALRWWVGRAMKPGQPMGMNTLAVLFVVMFGCAIMTEMIGIFAIFGAFLLGAVLSDLRDFREAIASQLRNFVTVFFLPIFFTYTGLRTDIGTLGTPALWGMAGLVCLVAIVGKFGGCSLAARLGGFSWRESTCIGIMMNTRALMELIVINTGYELGVIPRSVFCMLVIMAVLTTVITTPILLRFMPGTELEEYITRSDLAPRGLAIAR